MSLADFLYWGTLATAGLLLALVLAAPQFSGQGWRLVDLFAGDAATRKTAIAAAIGLIVTSQVFFRTGESRREAAPIKASRPLRPPVVGA